MKASTTRTIRYNVAPIPGKDAVTYRVRPSYTSVTLRRDGDTLVPDVSNLTVRVTKQVGEDSPVTVNPATWEADGFYVVFALIYGGSQGLYQPYNSATGIPVNVAASGVTISLTRYGVELDEITVPFIADGEAGKPGEDAVSINVSPQALILKRTGSKQRNIPVYVDLFKGESQIPYGDASQGNMQCSTLTDDDRTITEGLTWSFRAEDNRFCYLFTYDGLVDLNLTIPFTVTYNGKEYQESIIVRTIADGANGGKGTRGPALRGPQYWNDVPIDFQFQSGAEDEDFIDLVFYGPAADLYVCKSSHTKTSNNRPTSQLSENNNLWRLGTRFEVVATKILLAEYALVKNLGVEAIEMKDNAGNILFQAKDGNVICKTGTFENVVLSGVTKKIRTEVTAANFSSIFKNSILNGYNLDLTKSGTWLDIQYLPGNILVRPNNMRALCGNTILLYNNTQHIISVTSSSPTFPPSDLDAVGVNPGQFISLECKLGVVGGAETAYFLYQRGSINPDLDN